MNFSRMVVQSTFRSDALVACCLIDKRNDVDRSNASKTKY